MNHSFKKFLALVLTAATIFSLSAVAASSVFGADTAAGTGKTPIAAFDFKKDLKDHSGRTDVADVVIDEEPADRSDADRLKSTSHSGRAQWIEGTGIKIENGFFKLPDNIFSDTDISKIDGFTISFTVNKAENPYNKEWENFFSFAEKDYYADKPGTDPYPEGERSDTSIHLVYHGCIGSGAHPYSYDQGGGCWIDGAFDAWQKESSIIKYNESHEITITYETATNTLLLYVDGTFLQTSASAGWTVTADFENEDIQNLTSLIFGRNNDGYTNWWGFGTYSDVTIYSTPLSALEVRTLADEGWEAVKALPATAPVLAKDAPVLTGEGDGTFTAAAFNVDGLPVELNIMDFIKFSLNKDGRGAEGAEKLSKAIAEKGWDILGVAENFTYNEELKSALKDIYEERYDNEETVPAYIDNSNEFLGHFDQTGFPWVFKSLKTDGLSLFYKKDKISVDPGTKVAWEENYSPYKVYMEFYSIPEMNGADKLITKGFRHFVAEVATGVKVDVYTLHMDADDAIGDRNARAEQLKQLAKYIVDSKTENPIIIMGDTNCRYTRDDIIGNLIGTLNAEDNLYAVDAWVETKKDGNYPEFGSKTLDDEIVDKIIYVNNSKSDYELCLKKYEEVKLTDEAGESLSDHSAVVGTFAYAKKYDVTYTDGVDGAAFKPQTHHTLSTNETPKFDGTPARDGYVFKGWEPAVADTVTGTVTYSATWEAAPASDDPGTTPGGTTPGGQGQVTPPTTGDTAHVAALLTVLAISGIGVTAVIRSKKKDR